MVDLPEYSQKRSGAYFTPGDVSASLVAWACRTRSDRMLDPSCGDGQFLTLHPNSLGIEQNPLSARRASERAPHAIVHQGDFFAWARDTRERFDCAAGNPPFIRYQSFSGEVRRRALEFCSEQGVTFSGLASSWAPFLVATASVLKRGGNMAFVVPAEIGHAPYAAPLLNYLVASFSKVQIVAVRRKLFPTLSEDCWLLYTEGFGGKAASIGMSVVDEFVPAKSPPRPTVEVDLHEWVHVWNRRLRPYVLPTSVRQLYARALAEPETSRLRDFAAVGIGYVSGHNNFFHLRPSLAKRLGIPSAFLQPTLRNGRAMPERQITGATVENWKQRDEAMLLLRLSRDQELPTSIRGYLDSSAGLEARQGYKCRTRKPWYSVPDVRIPDFVMSYMSGRRVHLVRNIAGVSCTNSVHSIIITNQSLARTLLPSWSSPFVRLSCELEGHALGGGMLKIEPKEAGRIIFPNSNFLETTNVDDVEDAIDSLQRWRHYA